MDAGREGPGEEARIEELRRFLNAITADIERADPVGFVARCHASERLELLLDEFADRGPTKRRRTPSRLHEEATAFHRHLEDLNFAVVQRLREGIRSGRCAGPALLDQLQAYTAAPPPGAALDNLEYDCLDVLVAGLLGIDKLRDEELTGTAPEMVPYQPTPARVILELVKNTRMGPGDLFVDVGSGLGIVPIMVTLLSGAASIGMEVQPWYCRAAEEAARELNLSNVRFRCQDAVDGDFAEGTVFYLYSPFKGTMLRRVLDRLHEEGRRRPICVCTYGPSLAEAVEQHVRALERSGRVAQPITIFRSCPEATRGRA